MLKEKNHTVPFICLIIGLVILFILDLGLGPVKVPFKEVVSILSGSGTTKSTWEYIILNYRFPKAVTAVLAGCGLSIAGLLMQTLFRNPLAGPYVLGLSSGSSLGVAFVILGASIMPGVAASLLVSGYGIAIASCFGSFVVLAAVLVVSRKLRDTMAILIVGLMFGSFSSAIVGVLTYFSTAEQLQKFTFWALGNLGNLPWQSILILAVAVFVGLLIALICVKPLDSLLLGENYARSMGTNYRQTETLIIIATSILAGAITAFAGPIAFIGLAVPHMAKLVFRTSRHSVLFAATLIFGAVTMLICDIASQIPGTDVILPINAITSIIGAPIVIWLLLRKRKLLS